MEYGCALPSLWNCLHLALLRFTRFPSDSVCVYLSFQVAERTETMTSVEQTIVELGGIFQQFAHMVKEQEEMIQR